MPNQLARARRCPHRYRGINAHRILARIDRSLMPQQLIVVAGDGAA